MAALIAVVALQNFILPKDLLDLTPYKALRHIWCGDYATVSERQLDILQQIEDSDGGDVVVYTTAGDDDEWTNLKLIGTSDDPTYWVNKSVAAYFGVDSVTVKEE